MTIEARKGAKATKGKEMRAVEKMGGRLEMSSSWTSQ